MAYTIADIIARAKSLDPPTAAQYRNGDRALLCTTEIFREIIRPNGTLIHLKERDGRHLACYVRVSTVLQRGEQEHGDGYSEEFQIRRLAEHAIARGDAFAIYSDVEISGDKPYDDAALIRRLHRAKAERYRQAFTNIFLHEHNGYSLSEQARMRAYLDETLRDILAGTETLDDDLTAPGEVLGRSGRPRGKVTYRPALTVIMERLQKIHTVSFCDLTRLGRSMALISDIAERFTYHSVQTESVVEPINLQGQDMGDRLQGVLLSLIAEHKLSEVTHGTLRGFLALLQTGRPHGSLPFWLCRDERGFAVFAPTNRQAALRLVELYQAGYGQTKLALALQEEAFIPATRSGLWTRQVLLGTLKSKALIGIQEQFGLDWPVFPPLLTTADGLPDYDRWEGIQERITHQAHAHNTYRGQQIHLGSNLLRCHCGQSIRYSTKGKRTSNVPSYMCSTALPERRASRTEKTHAFTLNATDLHRFIDELMCSHSSVMLAAFQSDRERDLIREELAQLQEEAKDVRSRLREVTPIAEEAARKEMRERGWMETPTLLTALRDALMQDLLSEQKSLERRIEEKSGELTTYAPPALIASLEQRVERWKTLTVAEQNRVILTLFKEWVVEGHPPQEVLVPKLRTVRETCLPPIRLKSTLFQDGSGRCRRRLPTVGEWIDSAYQIEDID